MQPWRDQIRQRPYPRALDHVFWEFGEQLDGVSCGPSVIHHGLLLGGLTIPKSVLQAMLRTYPKPKPGSGAFDYLSEDCLKEGLVHLGLTWELFKRKSRETTREFLERLGPELNGGAFAIACIYLYEGTEEYSHWITMGRWKHGRIWALDSAWYPTRYSLTPDAFDACEWGNEEEGWNVYLVRPGIWQKNYDEWLPGRDVLLGLTGRSLEASATMAQLIHPAVDALNDNLYEYEQLEFCLSEKASLAIQVKDGRRDAVAVSTPTADEREGQVVVVRRLAKDKPPKPGAPELIFRMSELRGWQLS